MLRKQFDGARTTLDARRKRRAVFAGDHECVARREFVLVDMTTTRDAMDVMRVGMAIAGFRGGHRFSLSFGQFLFSFHRSLQHRCLAVTGWCGDTRFSEREQVGTNVETLTLGRGVQGA